MKYLDTAFQQLEFAMKLWNHVKDGGIDLAALDHPLTIIEGKSVLVLKDKLLNSRQDLEIAFGKLVGVSFGAAAITLDKSRHEAGIELPDPINTERDQFVALAYQIRNAFAHDIAEPIWKINGRYRRSYSFGDVNADLTTLDGERFDCAHIGGPHALFAMKDFGRQIWGN
jgi:hypothetical protein